MTPEQAERIRRYWLKYRGEAETPLKKWGVFRCAVQEPMVSQFPADEEVLLPADMPILEFRLERGYVEDKPTYRIVCDGLELESGPRRER
jgi:hypothetical protein